MRNKNRIHNLDTLEKEIYRQQLISKESVKKLENDFNYLRSNFFRMARNSSKKEESNSSFFDHVFSNDHVQKVVTGITDRITNHAADAINHLIDRLFKKHK